MSTWAQTNTFAQPTVAIAPSGKSDSDILPLVITKRLQRGRGLALAQSTTPIYQLKVTLGDVAPAVWRRILVPADITLFRLHEILQSAMPWTNSHMHRFIAGGIYSVRSDREFDMKVLRDTSITLAEVAPAQKRRFTYEYDMGDSWKHEVVVEKIVQSDPAVRYPICLAGERACPPEDCGGWSGYDSMLEAIGNPKHPDHWEMLRWLDGPFDPEAFDLVKVNKALARLARSTS